MTNVITSGVAPNGDRYLYSIGLAELNYPELVMIVGKDVDAVTSAALVFGAILNRQFVIANAGKPIMSDEVVELRELGIRARLRVVEQDPDYPLVSHHLRFVLPAVMQVTIEVRNDA